MKAIEILTKISNSMKNNEGIINWDCSIDFFNKTNEAIKELEDLKERILHLESIETDMIMKENKSCNNCKYQTIAEYSCKSCNKYYKDEWEDKE